jgi:hypothetical protein
VVREADKSIGVPLHRAGQHIVAAAGSETDAIDAIAVELG